MRRVCYTWSSLGLNIFNTQVIKGQDFYCFKGCNFFLFLKKIFIMVDLVKSGKSHLLNLKDQWVPLYCFRLRKFQCNTSYRYGLRVVQLSEPLWCTIFVIGRCSWKVSFRFGSKNSIYPYLSKDPFLLLM